MHFFTINQCHCIDSTIAPTNLAPNALGVVGSLAALMLIIVDESGDDHCHHHHCHHHDDDVDDADGWR